MGVQHSVVLFDAVAYPVYLHRFFDYSLSAINHVTHKFTWDGLASLFLDAITKFCSARRLCYSISCGK